MKNEEIKRNLKNSHSWQRGFYMLLFVLFYGLAETIILLIAVFQFFHVLITETTNKQLLNFGASVAKYIFQIMEYLTYHSQEKPFPFAEWPRISS